jgi:hypothetical protein
MLKRRPVAVLVLPLLAASCHLIDQRDFNKNAGRPPTPKMVVSHAHPTPSLVTILYTTPNPDYRDTLATAVQKALAVKPDVLFTVTALVPASGSDSQEARAAAAAASGREVAQAIVDSGAQAGQVEQAVRVDPAVTVREVIVTVH